MNLALPILFTPFFIIMLSSSFFPSTNLFNNSVIITAHRRPSLRIKSSHAAATTKRAMPTASPSLYDVLGLSVGASGNEIKAAYRKLARGCHPDVCKGSSSSADEFMRIHAAYSTLSDPSKRADYDRCLTVGQQRWTARTKSSPETFSGCNRRTWETDQCW